MEVVEDQERLQRSHDLRLRLIRMENRRLTRVLGLQNQLMERLDQRTAALREGIHFRQQELEHLLRVRRGRGEAVDAGCAAEAVNAWSAAEAVADVADGAYDDVADEANEADVQDDDGASK